MISSKSQFRTHTFQEFSYWLTQVVISLTFFWIRSTFFYARHYHTHRLLPGLSLEHLSSHLKNGWANNYIEELSRGLEMMYSYHWDVCSKNKDLLNLYNLSIQNSVSMQHMFNKYLLNKGICKRSFTYYNTHKKGV